MERFDLLDLSRKARHDLTTQLQLLVSLVKEHVHESEWNEFIDELDMIKENVDAIQAELI